jgi:hypothetical protein
MLHASSQEMCLKKCARTLTRRMQHVPQHPSKFAPVVVICNLKLASKTTLPICKHVTTHYIQITCIHTFVESLPLLFFIEQLYIPDTTIRHENVISIKSVVTYMDREGGQYAWIKLAPHDLSSSSA